MTQNDYIERKGGGFYIKGSRVPLDSVVHEFRAGSSPESIREAFPTLSLEQVYGAIAFFLGHQGEVEESIHNAERAWNEFESAHPVPASIRDRLREARGELTQRRQR
jgi:uncharacterized protein (DUF433 family)